MLFYISVLTSFFTLFPFYFNFLSSMNMMNLLMFIAVGSFIFNKSVAGKNGGFNLLLL